MKLYEGLVTMQMQEHGYMTEWVVEWVKDNFQQDSLLESMIVVGDLHGMRVVVCRYRYMSGGFLDATRLLKDVSNVLGENIILRPANFAATRRDGTKVLVLH